MIPIVTLSKKNSQLKTEVLHLSPFLERKKFLKLGCAGLFNLLGIITNSFSSDPITLFSQTGPSRDKRLMWQGEQPNAQKKSDIRMATKTINGVVDMYKENLTFEIDPYAYQVMLGDVVPSVNASYTHSTQTFWLPTVEKKEWLRGVSVISTACDQGIVSHEAGHMILNYMRQFYKTSHTGALHEGFADLTAQFYRFYNSETRREFVAMLEVRQGCVGDTSFTCTRDNAKLLSARQVAEDRSLCEEHSLSQVLSSAVYNSMVDCYNSTYSLKYSFTDQGKISIAGDVVSWHKHALVSAVLRLSTSRPTLMDVALNMLVVTSKTSLPGYREQLGRSFLKSGLIVILYQTLPSFYGQRSSEGYYTQNEQFKQLCRS